MSPRLLACTLFAVLVNAALLLALGAALGYAGLPLETPAGLRATMPAAVRELPPHSSQRR